jgi:hypothetical protein
VSQQASAAAKSPPPARKGPPPPQSAKKTASPHYVGVPLGVDRGSIGPGKKTIPNRPPASPSDATAGKTPRSTVPGKKVAGKSSFPPPKPTRAVHPYVLCSRRSFPRHLFNFTRFLAHEIATLDPQARRLMPALPPVAERKLSTPHQSDPANRHSENASSCVAEELLPCRRSESIRSRASC